MIAATGGALACLHKNAVDPYASRTTKIGKTPKWDWDQHAIDLPRDTSSTVQKGICLLLPERDAGKKRVERNAAFKPLNGDPFIGAPHAKGKSSGEVNKVSPPIRAPRPRGGTECIRKNHGWSMSWFVGGGKMTGVVAGQLRDEPTQSDLMVVPSTRAKRDGAWCF
jgi:hypothetical protein